MNNKKLYKFKMDSMMIHFNHSRTLSILFRGRYNNLQINAYTIINQPPNS